MTRQPGVVPLLARSSHSLLMGTTAIEDLVARAADLGHPALALTESWNLVREGWNGFNVLHLAAARMGALMLGFAQSLSRSPRNRCMRASQSWIPRLRSAFTLTTVSG